jgi:glycosyltransferase involved in cell wall biosynthesis
MKISLVPDVSIILTVFNREKYIKRCISSIINQRYENWKIIAIDDGSEDDSCEILNNYASQYKNIEVYCQKNMKLALSRNRGIELAASKYVTFIDSDDEYTSDHLEQRVKYMEANPGVDLIHGGARIIGNEYVRDKNNPVKFIHLSECFIGGTFFGKTEVFKKLNGFRNIPYSEDSDLLERAEKKFKIRKVEFKTYVYHRELEDSITNSYVPHQL